LLPLRAGAALFGLFGLLGLALAAMGVMGLISHYVSQRAHEIGIRLALGAQSRDIRALVVRQVIDRRAQSNFTLLLFATFAESNEMNTSRPFFRKRARNEW
jgi:hypothetical protein